MADKLQPTCLPQRRPRHPTDFYALLVGGETMDGPRHIWWNFVSSRPERIEQAKAEWKAGRFDTVPGDAEEFIPLPDEDKVVRYP